MPNPAAVSICYPVLTRQRAWQSQVGTLKMSLINIAPNAEGTSATLRIQGESNDPLPGI